ncbi:hypothetical protein [Paraburkholderia sp. BL27I4N3]|uniref:hypothetical protein n=1 Tax=Paraburkholderia sp. BL27I4N3 TaxID=1938805 RepID=UPI0015F28A5F|nr:hypothetical protein [Paraburkholderia sp. BL27I4N3]
MMTADFAYRFIGTGAATLSFDAVATGTSCTLPFAAIWRDAASFSASARAASASASAASIAFAFFFIVTINQRMLSRRRNPTTANEIVAMYTTKQSASSFAGEVIAFLNRTFSIFLSRKSHKGMSGQRPVISMLNEQGNSAPGAFVRTRLGARTEGPACRESGGKGNW